MPVLGHKTAGDIADAAEQKVNVGLECRNVERGVDAGGNIEGHRIHRVHARAEVHIRCGIVAADGAADVLVPLEAEIRAELQSMGSANPRQVIDELPRGDGTGIGVIVLGQVGDRTET